jgi:hypothetical protein
MPGVLYDAKMWRERAEEARVQAEQMRDAASREAMLEVARGYEKLAVRAEAREVGLKPK